MITGVVGACGGAGATNLGLLLSAAVGGHDDHEAEAVFVEADRAGGVVGARFDLGTERGVASWISGLAADAALPVDRFGKLIASGVRVLPGPVGWSDAERVLGRQSVELLSAAMSADGDRRWVVDLGRGGSALNPVAAIADAMVVVCPGMPEYVVRLPSLVAWARPAACTVVLTGRSPWPSEEVRRHCSADHLIEAPDLAVSAGEIAGLIEGRRRRRSRAWISVLACRDAVATATATTSADAPSATATTGEMERTGS